MMKTPPCVVFLFASVSHTLKAEKILKERGIAHKLIPVPREIGSDCGVCLRVAVENQELTAETLKDFVVWEKIALL